MLHPKRHTITNNKSAKLLAKISKTSKVNFFFYVFQLHCFSSNSIGSNNMVLFSDDNMILKRSKTFSNSSKQSCSNIYVVI